MAELVYDVVGLQGDFRAASAMQHELLECPPVAGDHDHARSMPECGAHRLDLRVDRRRDPADELENPGVAQPLFPVLIGKGHAVDGDHGQSVKEVHLGSRNALRLVFPSAMEVRHRAQPCFYS